MPEGEKEKDYLKEGIKTTVTGLFTVVPLAVCALYFGYAYREDTCQESDFSLSNWVIVAGWVLSASYILQSSLSFSKAGYQVVTWGMAPLMALFHIVWNIIGAVLLFEYNPSCSDSPLGKMALAIIILQWIGMCFVACVFCLVGATTGFRH